MDRLTVVTVNAKMDSTSRLGRLPFTLGYAGLIPQIIVVLLLLSGDPADRFVALAAGFAYAALILSFLGGLWWGLGAARVDRAPPWIWFAAVAPSLIALGSAWPWMVGLAWPQPSLIVLGISLIGSLGVDKALAARDLVPPQWMRLRTPLSLGLGVLTIVAALL